MTRFMITQQQGVELVWHAMEDMIDKKTYVRKIPSIAITEVARAVTFNAWGELIDTRHGENLHGQIIGPEDSFSNYEFADHYRISPAIYGWRLDPACIGTGVEVTRELECASATDSDYTSIDALRFWIDGNAMAMPA